MHYAGVRPERVDTLIALDGFGIPAEAPERAPDKFAAWLDSARGSAIVRAVRQISRPSPPG